MSAHNPVPASQEVKLAMQKEAATEQTAATGVLRYDADNKLIPPPKQRVG